MPATTGAPRARPGTIGDAPSEDGVLAHRRVLVLFPHMVAAGGALSYALRLSEQLVECGAKVAVLTLRAPRDDPGVPEGVDIRSLEGPLTSSLWYWLLFPVWQRRLSRAMESWQPDVVVPHVFPLNWWGWLHRRRHRDVKLVWVCHEPSAFIHSEAWIRALRPWWKGLLARVLRPLLSALDRSLVRYCDRLVVNSRFTGEEVKRVYGVIPDAVATPGIEYSGFSCGEKARELITVARLTRFKRVDFLLEVFREVLKSHPDLIYHIVGTGEEEGALRQMAARLDLEGRVRFHGAVDGPALASLYRRSMVFLHGAVAEPFGMAPLEAIASGTPVIAHRSGGPAEYVTDACGRLLSSLEVGAWARETSDYLELLSLDPGFPTRVRECARAHDWAVCLRPGIEVIKLACGEPSEMQP